MSPLSFFPPRMSSVTVVLPEEERDRVVLGIHRWGKAEVRDKEGDLAGLDRKADRGVASLLQRCEDSISYLSSVLGVCSLAAPKAPGGVVGLITPKKSISIPVRERSLEDVIGEVEEIREGVGGEIERLGRRHSSISQSILVLETKRYAVEMTRELGIDLSMVGRGVYADVVLGTTSDPWRVAEALSPYRTVHAIAPAGKDKYVMAVVMLRREEDRVSSALRSAGFFPLEIRGCIGPPDRELARIDESLAVLRKTREEVVGEIRELRERHVERLMALREELSIERERLKVMREMEGTERTVVLSFWCPTRLVGEMEGVVARWSGGRYLFHSEERDREDESVPSAMENPRWARPFQGLTTMFGPPGYGEIDPTKIIAPVFVIFFGLMLGDALYGALVLLTGILVYRGAPKREGARDFPLILIASGVSTIFFGIIQGGYFGPVTETQPNILMLAGFTPPVFMDTLKDPITLLVIALVVGLAYLNLGLLLAGIQNLVHRRGMAFLTQQVSWWLLQPAAIVLLGGGLFGWWDFSPLVVRASYLMTLVGLALLIVDKKGLFFFDLTGFIGSFLSFARLLALGLATAGIALTINVIVSMLQGAAVDGQTPGLLFLGVGGALTALGVWKGKRILALGGGVSAALGVLSLLSLSSLFFIALGAVVYLFAHLINTGLQALGAFVHSLRLQYVEFFGLFYEGSGRLFKPFREERRHTVLVAAGGRVGAW
ncbi:MAG: V-type ATP synthase subunit I [Thermoplasmata archaeon]|nr:V-type ATP synthase subunit I [Thermoplasmata archaeon]